MVYFRSGYSPHQYPTEQEWRARRTIEHSAAIKCPCIGAQLAGSKKIQQLLTDPLTLAGFEPDPAVQTRMFETFAQIRGLDVDDINTERFLSEVIKSPQNYVLKVTFQTNTTVVGFWRNEYSNFESGVRITCLSNLRSN